MVGPTQSSSIKHRALQTSRKRSRDLSHAMPFGLKPTIHRADRAVPAFSLREFAWVVVAFTAPCSTIQVGRTKTCPERSVTAIEDKFQHGFFPLLPLNRKLETLGQ